MKTRYGTRLFRRSCCLAPLPVTRHQIRQRVDRLRDINELEAVLELSRAKPDINYLLQLDLESNYGRTSTPAARSGGPSSSSSG
jgi:hypothetical protein